MIYYGQGPLDDDLERALLEDVDDDDASEVKEEEEAGGSVPTVTQQESEMTEEAAMTVPATLPTPPSVAPQWKASATRKRGKPSSSDDVDDEFALFAVTNNSRRK